MPGTRWAYLGPLAIAAVLGAFFGVGLSLNSREVSSPNTVPTKQRRN